MPNTIAQVKNVPVDGPNGPTSALMLALNIADLATAPAFVSEVAEHFKVQRMLAPPETSMLLITLMGDFTASQFAARWLDLETQDPVIKALMSLLTVADVIQGTATGQVLERASLLAPD
jgi:hypothetical protein